MPATTSEERLSWLVCLFGGALLVVGCALRGIEIGTGAFIGAGEEQRGFDYDRTIHLAAYARPGALLYLLGGIGLVVLSVVALRRGSRTALVLAAAAISFACVVQAARIADELQWSEGGGVYACEDGLERCAPFLAPAVRELQEDILQRAEARDPEFELLDEDGYRARGLVGWSVLLWTSILLAGITLFSSFRLVLRPLWAIVLVLLCGLIAVTYLFITGLQGLE